MKRIHLVSNADFDEPVGWSPSTILGWLMAVPFINRMERRDNSGVRYRLAWR